MKRAVKIRALVSIVLLLFLEEIFLVLVEIFVRINK